MFAHDFFPNEAVGGVLGTHACRWRDLGATAGEWMTLAVALGWGRAPEIHRAADDPSVAWAVRAVGQRGLSFVAAVYWPPVAVQAPEKLATRPEADVPW